MADSQAKPIDIKNFPDRIILLVSDQVMLTLAFVFAWWLSYESGIGGAKSYIPLYYYWDVLLVFNVFWLLFFAVFGLYGKWKSGSRFDELLSVYKTITIGGVVFIIISFFASGTLAAGKLIALAYWASLIMLVGTSRLFVRSVQRRLLTKGVGRRPTIIVGDVEKTDEMLLKISQAPALGYDVVGVVPTNVAKPPETIEGIPVLGRVKHLHSIIEKHNIQDVLIALEFKDEEEIFRLISAADSFDVDFSILPGPADVLAGRMMYNHLYGFPMIRILAEPMPPWEKSVKRMIDIFACLFAGIVFAPVMAFIALLIKIDSKGPILYSQERIGYRGRYFNVLKFRSMVVDAEKLSGPVWADKDDPRITRMGRFMRKTRIDELPQLWNIIKGEMSLVGPRPERPHFVEQFKKKIQYYPLRLKVKPGLTGWAQIKHNYDRSLDDVREKLKYDLYYIENMSLRMDFKIIIATVFVVIGAKGAH